MITIVAIAIIIICMIIILLQIRRFKVLKVQLRELNSLVKSQQVKFGKSFEHFVPFINDFPANRENTIFLGMPIDFISFEEDCIKFIEVKTGQSQLSVKQKKIRELVENKQVEWHELIFDSKIKKTYITPNHILNIFNKNEDAKDVASDRTGK